MLEFTSILLSCILFSQDCHLLKGQENRSYYISKSGEDFKYIGAASEIEPVIASSFGNKKCSTDVKDSRKKLIYAYIGDKKEFIFVGTIKKGDNNEDLVIYGDKWGAGCLSFTVEIW